ncbi:MAG: PhzF family phenazine biosynthesis protein [Desulfohalobiaceae bacterium]
MRIKQYQVDAFADSPFRGNPAAVCFFEKWPQDRFLQAIAAENNLSETAFLVPAEGGYALRWFTPVAEVDLCGHATIAAAYVLFWLRGYSGERITFFTRSGELSVRQIEGLLAMDFPADPPRPCDQPEALIRGLGQPPSEVLAGQDYVAVYDSESTVRSLFPNPAVLSELDLRGVVATAPGEDCDFVSRFFAPKLGVFEDPVTGSAHCELTPYWSSRQGKSILEARQVSPRGGWMRCRLNGDRVDLSGSAVLFLEGEIVLDDGGC